MASYEVEHGVDLNSSNKRSTRRPDMTTFFNKLSSIDTAPSSSSTSSPSRPHNNPHATPTPVDVRETYLLAADGLAQIMANGGSGQGEGEEDEENGGLNPGHARFLEAMIRDLHLEAEKAEAIKGVSQEFIDGLDRVPKKRLKKTDVCPICAEPFLDDPYPLVVQLPCHPAHRFDLECIAPWLKLQGTCPLDRKELERRKKKEEEVVVDEEEDYDDMIA